MNRISALFLALLFGLVTWSARADDMGALLTFTAQGAATVNSADQNNARLGAKAIVCVFNQASHTGSPSTTFKIQGKDAASGAYYDLIGSAAVTNDTTPTAIAAGVGIITTSNVGAGVPIPATWRVSATIGGTGTPKVTGTVGCNRVF